MKKVSINQLNTSTMKRLGDPKYLKKIKLLINQLCKDHKNGFYVNAPKMKNKKSVDVEEPVFDFMKKLIMHIPDAQFKMIRYYDIYAACHHKHREVVKKKQSLDNPARICKLSYRQDLKLVL